MLKVEEWMDVKMLANQGHSARAIARMTGYSRNTVAKLLRQAAPTPFQKPLRPSKLDPYKPYLRKRAQECPLSAVRLLEEIRPMGFNGSLCILQRFLAPLRSHQRAQAKATVRFETPPGHQAQVDWAHCGCFPDASGQRVKLYAFVMVLGFSRMLFVQFTTSMDLAQLLVCHLQAFSFFGGWTKELLYDNMAQVKLPGSGEWNPLFLDFVHHYGVIPHTCRVRRPRTKGKVERMVDYLKDNFLLGRSFADLADLNAQGHHWLTHTANVRLHSTTGERPIDLLAAEKLTALATVAPYRFAQKSVRQVSAEGFVHLARSRYSVPPEYVGRTVLVEEGEQRVIVRAGELIVAEHRRALQPGSCVVEPEHVAAFWKLCLPSGGNAAPSGPAWQMRFQEGVACRPLSAYEEAGAWAEGNR
jgi:transposase